MKAVVIGGGLGGCAAAIALRGIGWDVEVFEASERTRREGESISLWSNGTAALARMGIDDPPGEPIGTLRFQDRRGTRLGEADIAGLSLRLGYPNITVPREEMLGRLVAQLASPVNYAKRAVRVTTDTDTPHVVFADGSEVGGDLVVAADGVHSVLRSALWPGDGPVFLGAGIWQATAERPSGYPARLVSCTIAGGTFVGAFPTAGNRVNWFIDEHAGSPAAASDAAGLGHRFGNWPAPLPALLAATDPEQIRFYPIYGRRPRRHWVRGRVALLGDAAHAMAPALGQGAGQAFVDAVVLARSVAGHRNLDDGLRAYGRQRSRVARAYWRAAKVSLAVRGTPLFSAGVRVGPDRLLTEVMGRLVRPERTVR